MIQFFAHCSIPYKQTPPCLSSPLPRSLPWLGQGGKLYCPSYSAHHSLIMKPIHLLFYQTRIVPPTYRVILLLQLQLAHISASGASPENKRGVKPYDNIMKIGVIPTWIATLKFLYHKAWRFLFSFFGWVGALEPLRAALCCDAWPTQTAILIPRVVGMAAYALFKQAEVGIWYGKPIHVTIWERLVLSLSI